MKGYHRLTRFQTVEHLQSLAVGQELTHVVGIAVAQLRVPQSEAVVVDSHRAIHHLVETITVEVGNVQRVVALRGIGGMSLAVLALPAVVGVEAPTAGELTVAPVPCLDDTMTIHAASKHHRWQPRLIEAAYAHTERASSLPVAVAPRFRCFAVDEVVACQLATCASVDDGDELRTSRVVVVHPSRTAAVLVSPRAIVNLAVAVGVFNLLAVAKHRAFASADGHLGTAVAIEVGNSEARRVTQNDAGSSLDAPEQSAIELVGIPDNSPETVLL